MGARVRVRAVPRTPCLPALQARSSPAPVTAYFPFYGLLRPVTGVLRPVFFWRRSSDVACFFFRRASVVADWLLHPTLWCCVCRVFGTLAAENLFERDESISGAYLIMLLIMSLGLVQTSSHRGCCEWEWTLSTSDETGVTRDS